MISSQARLLSAAAVMFAVATSAQAESLSIGTAENSNCLPFTCTAYFRLTEYQQIYSSSAFTSPFTFDQITFPLGQDGPTEAARFAIYFGVTETSPSQISANLATNIGTSLSFFGLTSTSSYISSALTVSGDPFTFHPSLGNLIMDVVVLESIDLRRSSFGGFASGMSPLVGRAWAGQYPMGTDGYTYGLQTIFSGTSASAASAPASAPAPIPGSGALSFLAVGLNRLRRRFSNLIRRPSELTVR